MLVVFGGLPGSGKTTIARALASQRSATYLRIDVIEQAMRASGVLAGAVGPAGYVVGNALAESNLALGHVVIADCVNPVRESREGWRATAARCGKRLLEVEVICSDIAEHRRRVEQRAGDIDGLVQPTWQDVSTREYLRWTEPHLVVDTALLSPEAAIAIVADAMDRQPG